MLADALFGEGDRVADLYELVAEPPAVRVVGDGVARDRIEFPQLEGR